jgi:hypothetical protein
MGNPHSDNRVGGSRTLTSLVPFANVKDEPCRTRHTSYAKLTFLNLFNFIDKIADDILYWPTYLVSFIDLDFCSYLGGFGYTSMYSC